MAVLATLSCHEHSLLAGHRGCGRGPAPGGLCGPREGRAGAPWEPAGGHAIARRREACDEDWGSQGTSADDFGPSVAAGLAASLEQLVHIGWPQRVGSSLFHAPEPPAVSISDYVARLRRHFRCSPGCLVLALVYIDRATQRHPELEVGGLTCHRILAASLTLATKFLDDEVYSNRFYSEICGVPLRELNALEGAMMELLRGDLHVRPEEFDVYQRMLAKARDCCSA